MTAGNFSVLNFNKSAQVRTDALTAVAASSMVSLTPDQMKDFRLKLLRHLQKTMELDQVIEIFHHHLQHLFPVSGIEYTHGDKLINIRSGEIAKHRANYLLLMRAVNYGEITFSRNKRFTEKELACIESIMDLIIFPVHNALKYSDALHAMPIDTTTSTSTSNRVAVALTHRRKMARARAHEEQFVSVVMVDVDYCEG
ncbi:MAG: hypothetical protein MUQ43_06585 [Reinekea forsetii]|uniref:hypothetical protein n=1 Tax=Reinekea forsetii TaxID=1336806 RepID=UPI0023526E17|nr:hypothetical protein [Reinekea forsetii]MDO7641438.1 hypothetical protein [Reinekea forsetii]MDO7645338.1 hypothetical protein [Reinekea forsetii]MDO7674077.1 hypothetical protein [Reinekea forsetii]